MIQLVKSIGVKSSLLSAAMLFLSLGLHATINWGTVVNFPDPDLNKANNAAVYSPTALPYKLTKSEVWIKADLKKGVDFYKLGYANQLQAGQTPTGNQFKLQFDLNFKVYDQNANVIKDETVNFVLENYSPEKLYVFKLPDMAVLPTVEVTIVNSTGTQISPDVQALVEALFEVNVTWNRELAVDVATAQVQLDQPSRAGANSTTPGRIITFSWATKEENNATLVDVKDGVVPFYQVQLLRLFNEEAINNSVVENVKTTVDWKRALTIETKDWEESVRLTVAEGNGYYLWRVRPIGNYYTGALANDQNWGAWSTAPLQGEVVTYSFSDLQSGHPYMFFMTDPDDDKNWIYSRVISEEMKTGEQIIYANGLNQAKQTQSNIASTNQRAVAQSVYDYSGRASLTVVPVPSNGELNGYKPNFVKNEDGTLYSAKDFDTDAKQRDPSKVTGEVDDYHSGNSTMNDRGADMQGYTYSRTLYHNDGIGKVSEQSAPGKTHSLGTQTADPTTTMGRTTRTQYENATAAELLRIFGDEAPNPEKVLKVLTTDPNNVTTVTYICEGKTIATCLAKNEDKLGENLMDPIVDNQANFKIVYYGTNVSTSEAEVTSFLNAVLETTGKFEINYSMPCNSPTVGCTQMDGDCKYDLTILIKSQFTGEVQQTIAIQNKTCAQINELAFPMETQELEAGGYVIYKKLTPSAEGKTEMENAGGKASDNTHALLKPVMDVIVAEIEERVKNNTMDGFPMWVNTYNADLNKSDEEFKTIYGITDDNFQISKEHQEITIKSVDEHGVIEAISLMNCCGKEVVVPVKYTPAETFSCDPAATVGVKMWESMALKFGESAMGDLMPGYDKATFAKLIENMLTDGELVNGEYKYRYDCKDVWSAWTTTLNSVTDMMKGNEQTTNVSQENSKDGNNDENGENYGDKQDQNADENADGPGWFMELLMKRSMAKRLREDITPGKFKYNAVKHFMNTVGYKFKSVIVYNSDHTGIVSPIDNIEYTSVAGGFKSDPASAELVLNIPESELDDEQFEKQYPSNFRRDGNDNVRLQLGENPSDNDPYILTYLSANPTRIYKYFEYIDGSDKYKEFGSCYRGPDSQDSRYASPCYTDPCTDKSYQTWNQEELFKFFTQVSSYSGYVEGESTTNTSDFTRENIDVNLEHAYHLHFVGLRNSRINSCNTGCEKRRPEIRQNILDMLASKCYKVDEGCPGPDVVTMEEVDKMVDKIIAECKEFCPNPNTAHTFCTAPQTCATYNYRLRGTDITNANDYITHTDYFEIQIFTPTEKMKEQQAKTWALEVDIDSQCPNVSASDVLDWADEATPTDTDYTEKKTVQVTVEY
ncbi:MAG: hypothetical protein ACKOXB_12450 [Flavobacteriales bacterium]